MKRGKYRRKNGFAELQSHSCNSLPRRWHRPPEIADSVKEVFRAAEVPIEWEEHYVGREMEPRTQSFLTSESLESVCRNKVGLKGPMATPIGKGHRSLNLTLRKELNLNANVSNPFCFTTLFACLQKISLYIIFVVKGVVESLKIVTRQVSLRVAEYAFLYAKNHGRQRVSAIHKANIMQKTDGHFLKQIAYEEVVIIENCSMMLVKNPALFDVWVMPNLSGDIISDLCAALIGGLGLTPSCNIGEGGVALAEAVHGSAQSTRYCWKEFCESNCFAFKCCHNAVTSEAT
ncbi:unnamed protein product [Coffea canephora]|uniref:Isopropylmalate dehydrogenase-like domain-containing protein n=1 Tax=Coffea canephora TaxID=49390 RepID=A0A068UFF6_COFCA|nr:unnamed protein product [Coffea canephora]